MMVSLILALAGLSAAAPAAVSKGVVDAGFDVSPISPTHLPEATASVGGPLPMLSNGWKITGNTWPERRRSVGPRHQRRAEVDVIDSSHDEAEVSAGPVSTSTQTISSAGPSATGNDIDSLDEDLASFQMDPAYSRLAEEQNDIPYPYTLVIEDYSKTTIHQAIETHDSEVSDNDYGAYDASVCAQYCNEHRACDAFAIYIERGASCTDCSDPEAIDVAKCDLYNTVLLRPDMRKEAEQESIQGQTITRAVRGYNGYNRIQKTVTVTATRTLTVEATIVAYRTRTITITSPVTSTMHHTMSGSNSTVTRTAPASSFTVTSTKPAATVTKTSIKSTATVTQTSTKSSSAKPTTATVTKTSTKTSSAKPTTVTKTSTKPTATVTKTSTKSTATITKTSTKSSTKTDTIVFTSPTTKTAPPTTKTRTAKPTTITKTQNETVVVSATAEAEAEISDSEGEVLPQWE